MIHAAPKMMRTSIERFKKRQLQKVSLLLLTGKSDHRAS
jgi:hypothetical protein